MISQAVCNSYKQEILSGLHSSSHTYKIALYTAMADLDKHTTSYTGTSQEVSGIGYNTTGQILVGFSALLINDTAILTFSTNPSWAGATFTARGALIYNDSLPSKNAVAVLDFSSDQVCNNGLFLIIFPTPSDTTALVRIS